MTVTLEQLREEFRAALVQEYFGTTEFDEQDDEVEVTPERHIERKSALIQIINGCTLTQTKVDEIGSRCPSYQLARRYIIARDFNEFDPQKADMLWKLQRQ